MPSPFPGMDPYLEDPTIWPGVHAFLITAFAEMLNRLLRPKYVADVEERIYLRPESDDDHEFERPRVPDIRIESRGYTNGATRRTEGSGAVAVTEPLVIQTLQDDETRERRVEIRTTNSKRLVTVIEVWSPSNKTPGSEGRRSFLAKRAEVTASRAHWVEIDLLRTGESLVARKRLDPHEYLIHVSPVHMRPRGYVWPVSICDPLPTIGIPLGKSDEVVPLELQRGLELVYERGSFDLKIDYAKPPVPPLPAALARWANKLLKSKKLR